MSEIAIGIVKMPIGNLQSAWNAVHELGFDPVWVDEKSDYDALTHLILPGVGNFRAVMDRLNWTKTAAKIRTFAATARPLLGICVGMQLLADLGTEGGDTLGLGLVPGRVDRLSSSDQLRLPHVGWSPVDFRLPHPVFSGVKTGRDFYFVHSYALKPKSGADALAVSMYGTEFVSVAGHKNVLGFQFHPEKSQINGLKLLENFCHWDGRC